MKVDNPEFGRMVRTNEVKDCYCCPLTVRIALCKEWLESHNYRCPTQATYAEACELAERVF